MKNKSLHDLEASLAVIQINMKAYDSGSKFAYLPVAVELRKLLCDTQQGKDNSLIKRLFTDLYLRPLLGKQENIDPHTFLFVPGRIQFDGRGGSSLSELFNESAPSISLDEWLQQKLFDERITIREFIRSIADKEAAHSDTSYNSTLMKTNSVNLADDTLAAQTILTIGRYVIKALAIRLVNNNISEIRSYITSEFSKKGRGVAILDLAEFAGDISNGLPIRYEPSSAIDTYFRSDIKYHAAALQILQEYEAAEEFILLIIDLNGGIWLYKQVFHENS